MLRITGGEFRGRKIKTLEGKGTRPILSRVRKSLFDLIGNKVAGADFLDLFSGTGSVGIEALSRNAKSAAFVENENNAFQVIRENLSMLGLAERSNVYRMNVLAWLDLAADRSQTFDIIFIGPPYFKGLADRTLNSLEETEILKKSAVIFVQHHRKEKISFPDKFVLQDFRKYGDTALSIIKVRN